MIAPPEQQEQTVNTSGDSMNADTGGPAFPFSLEVMPDRETHTYMGATLRDYFAAKAMQGLLAQSMGTALGSEPRFAAEYAYRMADAMLAERNK